MSEHSLKVFVIEQLTEKTYKNKGNVSIYSKIHIHQISNSFTKLRWIIEQQRESFSKTFINNFVSKCKEETGGDDFVIAYGDGSFGLTMKGIDGGGSAHRRLMIRQKDSMLS